jgi:hypothetical protein
MSKSLTLWQRLQLRILGYAYLRHEQREGWREPLPIFAVKCSKHGVYEDYPHGLRGYFVYPQCKKENKL